MESNRETKIVKYNQGKEELSVQDLIEYIKILDSDGMDTALLVKELIWKIGQTEEYLKFFEEKKGYLDLREDIDPVLYRLISKIYGRTNILESTVNVCKVRNFGEAYKIGNCRLVQRLLERFDIADYGSLPHTRCSNCFNIVARKYPHRNKTYKNYVNYFVPEQIVDDSFPPDNISEY